MNNYACEVGEKTEFNPMREVECNRPPLSALVDETSCMAGDALNKVYRVNQHLFNIGEPKVENMPEIKCFQDVVVRQAVVLKELNAALEVLMSKLGV